MARRIFKGLHADIDQLDIETASTFGAVEADLEVRWRVIQKTAELGDGHN